MGASPPDPHYRLALRARHILTHHTFRGVRMCSPKNSLEYSLKCNAINNVDLHVRYVD